MSQIALQFNRHRIDRKVAVGQVCQQIASTKLGNVDDEFAKRIIEAHRGELALMSLPDKGTQAIVILPRKL